MKPLRFSVAITTTRPYVKSRTKGKLRLKWRAVDGAKRYDVQFKCGKKWETAKGDVKGTTATLAKVKVWDPNRKKAVRRIKKKGEKVAVKVVNQYKNTKFGKDNRGVK